MPLRKGGSQGWVPQLCIGIFAKQDVASGLWEMGGRGGHQLDHIKHVFLRPLAFERDATAFGQHWCPIPAMPRVAQRSHDARLLGFGPIEHAVEAQR